METRLKGHQRNESLTLVGENSSILQKCNDTSEPHFVCENISRGKIYVDIKSGGVRNTMESVPGRSAKVETSFITSLGFS